MILSWKETRSGIISAGRTVAVGQTIAMGFQHVLAMFGATVVAPLIMGFDPNLAILFSGIGTLIFFVIVGGAVPSYLGSSFAFIGPVAAVVGTPRPAGPSRRHPPGAGRHHRRRSGLHPDRRARPSTGVGLDRRAHAAAGHRRSRRDHRP